MKKILRITMLIAAILVLLTVTAFMTHASPSAPTGSTTQSSAHSFSVIINGTRYYYNDLESAVADVPDCGTIILLKNAIVGGKYVDGDHPNTSPTESGYIMALHLGRAATYTIDGNGYTLTLTPGYSAPSSTSNPDTAAALHINAGHVTIKNTALLLSDNSIPNVAIYLQNPTRKVGTVSLTIDNVQMSFKHKYGIWSHQEADVTIKGEKTLITGSTEDALRIQGGANASTYKLEGGTVIGSKYGIELIGPNSKFIVTGGLLSAPTPVAINAKSTLQMSGGSLKVGVGGTLLSVDSSVTEYTTTLTGGTIIVQDKAGVPSNANVNTSALDLLWAPDYITLAPTTILSVVIPTTKTFKSASEYTSFVKNNRPTISSTGFKSVSYATIVPIRILASATLNITAGVYESNHAGYDTLFYVDGGTLNISGGTFKNTHPNGSIIRIAENTSSSSVTVSGGTFYASKNLVNVAATSIPSKLSFSNCTIIMDEHATRVFEAASRGLDKLTYKNLTVLSKVNCVITQTLAIEVQNSRILFGGVSYGAYFQSTPTTSTLDVSNSDKTYAGASVHITETLDLSGIRFITVLSPEVTANLLTQSGTLSFGTIIAPVDYVIKAGAFTIEALSALSVSGNKYEKIPAIHSIRDLDENGIPEAYSAALINLKEKNYTRAFAAISYVEINGVIHYGSFNANENARSIQDVARKSLQIADYFTGDEVLKLKSYAGITKSADKALALTWTRGAVGSASHTSPLQLTTSLGYSYSDIIHIEKAGTAITFTDPNTTVSTETTFVISHWKEEGGTFVLDTNATNYTGADEAVKLTAYGETHYFYVSSKDNEYIRISCRQLHTSPVTVYMEQTNELGTEMSATALRQNVKDFTINGVSLANYQIVLKNGYSMTEWFAAIYLKNLIYDRAWISLPLVEASKATSAYRIEIGTATDLLSNEHTFISRVRGSTWLLSANSIFAYNALKDYCANELFSGSLTNVALDTTYSHVGNGRAFATEPIEKTGDLRILFNNIWGDGSHLYTQRAQTMVELYAAYSPDIIGLQECAPSMRDGGILSGLTALGYSEVPSDPGNHYHNGESVTRNPIFYNPNSVDLLAYGFASFAIIDFGKYPELMGTYTAQELSDAAKDDGSKSVTWGIFRSKETGDIFLLGSTHLFYSKDDAALTDTIRTIQMRELREAVTAAAATYMNQNGLEGTMPIIVGGDYNSRFSYDSYQTMSGGALPFTNLNDLVTDAQNKLIHSTSHGYPTWCEGLGEWQHTQALGGSHANAIDHVFCSKESEDLITVNHMGMPTEKDHAFMSDHSAIFADFSFKANTVTEIDPDMADDTFDSTIFEN